MAFDRNRMSAGSSVVLSAENERESGSYPNPKQHTAKKLISTHGQFRGIARARQQQQLHADTVPQLLGMIVWFSAFGLVVSGILTYFQWPPSSSHHHAETESLPNVGRLLSAETEWVDFRWDSNCHLICIMYCIFVLSALCLLFYSSI